jgi:putative MATE family efflux protein
LSSNTDRLGTEQISKLLVSQSVPAAIGIMVLSIYMIVDTIFVGQFVGPIAIGAVTVVLPITFLISSIGMALGVGGGSIIARTLGSQNQNKANRTYGNQITMIAGLILVAIISGILLDEEILKLFGGKGDILEPALSYYYIILVGVPFLATAMMSNQVIRAQGFPKTSMYVMMIPAVLNLALDPILIVWLNMGLEGAAWATTVSYVCSASYAVYFMLSPKSTINISLHDLIPDKSIITEINSLGAVSMVRQGVVSILTIIINNTLFAYGGELYISAYGIVSRFMMFALFPVIGIAQGILPIVGFNFGADNFSRVKKTIRLSLVSGTAVSFLIWIIILIFSQELVGIFTKDPTLNEITPPAIMLVFLATPLIGAQLIGASYFQAIGNARTALFLTLTRQGFFLIPLIYILPFYFDINGIWYAFPISDFIAFSITLIFMIREYRKL